MPYTDDQIETFLNQFPDWAYDPSTQQAISTFEFPNFVEAMEFVNAVGEAAERFTHHPNILVYDYNKVQLATTTHDDNGLTDKDAELVAEVETIINQLQGPRAATPVADAPTRQVGNVPVEASPAGAAPITAPAAPATPAIPTSPQPGIPGAPTDTPFSAAPEASGQSDTQNSPSRSVGSILSSIIPGRAKTLEPALTPEPPATPAVEVAAPEPTPTATPESTALPAVPSGGLPIPAAGIVEPPDITESSSIPELQAPMETPASEQPIPATPAQDAAATPVVPAE